MSRIDELVSEMCPRGVEIRRLGQVGTFTRGNGLQKKDFVDSGVGCIHYGQIYTHYGTSATATKSFVAPEMAARLRMAKPGDLVVATTSENDEDVCKAVAWLGQAPVAVSGDAYIYSHTLEPKYVSYFFQSRHFQDQKAKFINGTKVKRVSGENLGRISLPLPPIEVQREVVRVLDKFAALEAELEKALEAELNARRRQREHYRELLLTLPASIVRRVPLGEIATIGTGSRNTNEAVPGGAYPFFVRSQDALCMDGYEYDEVAVITAGDGVGVGKIFHFVEGKYALHQRAYRIHPTSPAVNPRFLFHFIRNDFSRYLATISVHASVTSLRKPMFEKYPVPVPPLDHQVHIVEVLDKFDALVNDLSVGLPAELLARRRQYEHYRDQLLTFPEAP